MRVSPFCWDKSRTTIVYRRRLKIRMWPLHSINRGWWWALRSSTITTSSNKTKCIISKASIYRRLPLAHPGRHMICRGRDTIGMIWLKVWHRTIRWGCSRIWDSIWTMIWWTQGLSRIVSSSRLLAVLCWDIGWTIYSRRCSSKDIIHWRNGILAWV